MQETIITSQEMGVVEKKVPAFITKDGVTFRSKNAAAQHEALVDKYPKLSKEDMEWMECQELREVYEEFEEALAGDDVLIMLSHSGGDPAEFERVEPRLPSVRAVIKALHRKTIGMGCNQYVDGVVYKGESLCFDDNKKEDGTFYTTGSGRNIKDVLPE